MKIILITIVMVLSGCVVDSSTIKIAEMYCKDKGGLDYIMKANNTLVYCNDGTGKGIHGVQREFLR